MRIAIRPKASGSTVCAIHVVTPAAITVPASRSLIISWYAPAQSIADTAAATVAARIRGCLADSTGRQEGAGRQRQHRAFARGQRRAEKADPQHQMLDERNGSGNADAEHPPKHDLGERHHDHHGKRDARQARPPGDRGRGPGGRDGARFRQE